MEKGLFVTFEGIDSAGKTTQQELLARNLSGRDVFVLKGFSQSVVGNALKELRKNDWFMRMGQGYGFAETALFLSEFLYRTTSEVVPIVNNGGIALKDRYVLTSLAYQSYFLMKENGISPDKARQLFSPFIRKGGIILPDLTVVLYSSIDTAVQRIKQKDRSALSEEEIGFLYGALQMLHHFRDWYSKQTERAAKKTLYIDTDQFEIEETRRLVFSSLEGLV